jgi:pimeloyl-ACP methyl ester carboxylesterase
MIPALDPEQYTFAFLACRGYGVSRDLGGAYTIEEIGTDAVSLVDSLGWERFHVVGHSMGGMAAQWLCVVAARRVKSAVLVNPVPASGFPMDAQTWELFSGAATSAANRAAIIATTTGNRHNAAWLRSMVAASLENSTKEAFAAHLTAWAKTDFADRMTGLRVPMLVIAGEHDLAVTPQVLQMTILQWVPDATLSVIRNAGHYPMNETPIDLADQLQGFLARHA